MVDELQLRETCGKMEFILPILTSSNVFFLGLREKSFYSLPERGGGRERENVDWEN